MGIRQPCLRTSVVRGWPAAVALAVLGLGGCSSTNGGADQLIGGLAGGSKPAGVEKFARLTMVAMPQIVGGPDTFKSAVIKQLNDAAIAHNVAIVVDPAVACDYALHGYLMSQRDANGVKVLYVWDILDKAGTRVNRLSGETATTPTPKGRNEWEAIPPAVTADMVDKALTSIPAQQRVVTADASHLGRR